jgi:hypothetical protein
MLKFVRKSVISALLVLIVGSPLIVRISATAASLPADDVASYLNPAQLPPGVPTTRPRVFIVGDSTLAALEWEPAAQSTLAGLDFKLDAKSCRTISIPSCRGRNDPVTGVRTIPDNGLTVVGDEPANEFDELVLMIGYNESSATFAQSLPLMLNLARSKGYRHVTWLTFHVAGTYQPPLDGDASYRSNNVILKAAVAAQNGYLTLLDWNTYADDTGGLLQSDGAHLSVAGAYAVGDFIHSAVDVLWGARASKGPSELAHEQRTPEAGGYVISPSPVRLLDTRGLNGPLGGGGAVRVLVPGGTAFAAASVNVTAVGASAPGFFTAYSCTAAVPNVSTLNFDRGETRAASTLVSLDAEGGFCLSSSVRSHAIVDLLGVIDPATAGSIVSQKAVRAFDSRTRKLRLTANTSLRIALPVSGAEGVSVIATAVDATADGWLAVTPTGPDGTCAVPSTSNLNFIRANAVANAVGLAVDRLQPYACLYASAPVHVLIDVMATIDSGAASTQAVSADATRLAPVIDDRWRASSVTRRIIDTREKIGKSQNVAVMLPAGTHAVTVTAAEPASVGFVTAYPASDANVCGPPPNASLINIRPGGAAANMMFVDPSRALCLYASSPTQVIVDTL